jgi:hypothetical protein
MVFLGTGKRNIATDVMIVAISSIAIGTVMPIIVVTARCMPIDSRRGNPAYCTAICPSVT